MSAHQPLIIDPFKYVLINLYALETSMQHVKTETLIWSKETSAAKTHFGEEAASAKSGSQGFCLFFVCFLNTDRKKYTIKTRF